MRQVYRIGIPAVFSVMLLMCGVTAVRATVPMVKTQPGFYRLMLGDFEITALNDGVVAYPMNRVLPTATPEQIAKGLSENALTDPVGFQTVQGGIDATKLGFTLL